jgi:3-deoxy-manno-octulosonate cytidylyltransferase (CMP-KDO synthetase)
MKTIVVIPARLASMRLPNKVLLDIAGQSMLWHVYNRCLQASKVDEVHIATDSEKVMQLVETWGGNVWMTDSNCVSGTERIVSILDKLAADIIINVQADQPLIEPTLINQLVEVFENTNPLPDIVTPICLINDNHKLFDPNLVKVTRRHDGYALYFSRSPIPYMRDLEPDEWLNHGQFWGHVGIYAYKRQILENYHLLPDSDLENTEKLEQLRFLQAGKSILTITTNKPPLSVDTDTDLSIVRKLIC